MKAVLIDRGKGFPKTHDLAALASLCADAGLKLAVDPDELDRLSAYAVQTRCPGQELTLEDADQASATAKVVRGVLRRTLGLK